MKRIIKKVLPRGLIYFYHGLVNYLVAFLLNFPSKKLVVIGITGTKGKTTTSYLVYYLLKNLGYKVCLISSEFHLINDLEVENEERVTMPGRGYIQKFLKRAVEEKCEIAVLEVTSEGLMQNRHWGLYFDIAVFLGIHPEHIEHHGGFINYRNAKGKLFYALTKNRIVKYLRGVPIKKTIIVNIDDKEADYFLRFAAENKITFGIENTLLNANHLKPDKIIYSSAGTKFSLNKINFRTKLLGKINLYNTLASIAVMKALEIPLKEIVKPLADFKGLPGRLEILTYQKKKIIIDYAHTPDSLAEVCKLTRNLMKPKRLLLLIGAAGGLRDKWKRPVLGEVAITYADEVVITNEDPYDEEPRSIMEAIEIGIKKYIAEYNFKKPYQIIEDRGEAIRYLIEKAKPGDVVLITGKGNEKNIIAKGQKIPWNDKEFVLSIIKQKR